MKVKDGCFEGEIPQMENSDSGYFLDECKEYGARVRKKSDKMTCYGPVLRKGAMSENGHDYSTGVATNSVLVESQKRMSSPENPETQNKLCKKMKSTLLEAEASNYHQQRNKYECLNCKKNFNSYHALGGHRPFHKIGIERVHERNENNPDYSTDFRKNGDVSSRYTKKTANLKKNKGHVCPFCRRVFKNGQALGGHKKTHFIGGRMENVNQSPVPKPKLLDLNLPAPEESEEDSRCQFFS